MQEIFNALAAPEATQLCNYSFFFSERIFASSNIPLSLSLSLSLSLLREIYLFGSGRYTHLCLCYLSWISELQGKAGWDMRNLQPVS